MTLPAELERATRIANVPESLRALVRRVGPLALRVGLGDDAHFHATLPQLLKLAQLEPEAVSLSFEPGLGATTVTLSRGGERVELPWESLSSSLGDVLIDGLSRLMSPGAALGVAHAASRELARLDALHLALGAMIDPALSRSRGRGPQFDDPVEHALSIFLAAVTAGSGLGFHRAALFVRDPQRRMFVGHMGVGPVDEAEAHRTWESLEAEAVPFERQLAAASPGGRFGERVRGVELPVESELCAAAIGGALPFERDACPPLGGLAKLEPAASFALVPVAVGERILGMLYVDRRFSGDVLDAALLSNLVRFVAHAALAWETLRLLREVQELARTDALTGLLNRRELEARFTQERSRAQRGGSNLSLLVIDLDEFHEINQRKGHEGGDAVLRTVAKILSSTLRSHDVAARFGGDEFVIVLPGAGTLEAASVARRVGVAAHRRGVSLSVGAASFPEDTDHPDDLFGLADKNLFAAKEAGRGRASFGGDASALVFAEEDEQGAG